MMFHAFIPFFMKKDSKSVHKGEHTRVHKPWKRL